MTIIEAYNNFRNIDLLGIAQDIVIYDGDLITELQKDQLMYGKDATGEDVAPSYYSDAYAEMKQKMNSRPETGTPDLRLTGEFYNGFYFDHDTLTVTSSAPITEHLIKKYGKHIFGLNENTVSRYRQIFNPKLLAVVKAKIEGYDA